MCYACSNCGRCPKQPPNPFRLKRCGACGKIMEADSDTCPSCGATQRAPHAAEERRFVEESLIVVEK